MEIPELAEKVRGLKHNALRLGRKRGWEALWREVSKAVDEWKSTVRRYIGAHSEG